MKSSVLILILALIGLQAKAETRAQCSRLIQLQEQAKAEAIDRFHKGEVTRSDISAVNLELRGTQLHCHLITLDVYCQEALLDATVIVNGTRAEAGVGQRTTQDVIQAEIQLAKVQTTCE